jgi:YD repeat-containing protein
LVNNQVIGGSLTTYKPGGGSYVPDKIYSLETTSPLSAFTFFDGTTKDTHYSTIPEIDFNDYNPNGAIRQLTGHDGVVTSYLWDSTGSYPMAQVKGATYQQILSYDGQAATLDSQTLCNNLKNLLSSTNPSPFITTYTYKPLVGITSQTDPNGKTTYYGYDDFGRLKNVKDDEGKLLKNYQYHYINGN